MPPPPPPTDVLGAPFTAETLPLRPDAEGEVVATLVHLPAEVSGGGSRGAVLHVHGFADYFFQTGYAAWFTSRGWDFYAVDLRKYGRSIRPHQTPTMATDLRVYGEELDAAYDRITRRDGHDRVVVSAHSTGALVAGLWAKDRRPTLVAIVLNSPWLDLQGSVLMRTAVTRAIDVAGRLLPDVVVPRRIDGRYGRSLHRDHEGDHDFDLAWKPVDSFPVRLGWLRAVRRAHAELHRGLDLPCPVLLLSSARSAVAPLTADDLVHADVVLDVRQMWRWAGALGPRVDVVAVEGARHDVVLSTEPALGTAYEELGRWLGSHVDARLDQP